MSLVYILAHLDDEYAALPLIWAARRARQRQVFFYLADYADPRMAARRLAETRAFLGREGIEAQDVRPLAGYAIDGRVSEAAGPLLARLDAELRALAPAQLITPAWEGGHMDHDTCAFLTAALAARLKVEARQFTLYNGPGLPGPLLRGGAPLPQNGRVERLHLTAGEWLRWMAAVRFFPSQLYAWSGIWPVMFAGMARRGFGSQGLATERVLERPHAGQLFYERMFKVPYADVRQRLDQALADPPGDLRQRGSTAT